LSEALTCGLKSPVASELTTKPPDIPSGHDLN